ncbi:MAG: hypothetical protein IJU52_04250 [Clostridia bacterium]|nr:hypothetical protein [Clostridia bacterium]
MATTSEKRGLRRTAREIKNYRILMKILPAVAAILALLIVIVYIITVLYNKYGSFTVMVNKYDGAEYGLTLSENRDFFNRTSRLNSKASEEITNICGYNLPENFDTDVGGVKHHDGDDFVAYTFFVMNAGTKIIDVDYQMIIVNMTKDIEEAVRVRVYIDGVKTDYARPRLTPRRDSQGNVIYNSKGEPDFKEEHICDEMFYSDHVVLEGLWEQYQPGAIKRVTVVIWLEGDDDQCKDNIIGGEFKVDMNFSVHRENDAAEVTD